MLMKDAYFVGQKTRYDGGGAVMRKDSSTIELFDDEGKPLKTVALEEEKGGGVASQKLLASGILEAEAKARPLLRPSPGSCPT